MFKVRKGEVMSIEEKLEQEQRLSDKELEQEQRLRDEVLEQEQGPRDEVLEQETKLSDEEFEQELLAVMSEDGPDKKQKKVRKKWSKKRKIITGAAAAVVVLALAGKVMGGGKGPQMFVMTSPIEKGDIVETLSVNGPIEGTDSVEVVSNLHAEIIELPVKEGDHVAKDQVLAVLDRSDLEKEVAMAQNSYDVAVSTLRDKELEVTAGYGKAVQAYNAAKLNFDRTNMLFQTGDVSQVDLETAQNAMNDAKREVDTYLVENGKAVPSKTYQLQIDNARYELEKKQEMLEDTQIKSPIDGTVIRVNSKVGRFADTTDDDKPIFMIENLDVLEMKIKISEYSIGKVAVGQKVSISADILNGDVVDGEVTAISPTGEEKGSGSTERVIPTTIRIMDNNTRDRKSVV